MIALLCVIIVILIGVIIYLAIKGNKKAEEHLEEEKEMLNRLHQKEIDGVKQVEINILKERDRFQRQAEEEKYKLNKEITDQQNLLKSYKTDRTTIVENEVALFREEQLNKIKEELIRIDLEQKAQLEQQQEIYRLKAKEESDEIDAAICTLRQCCEDLKAKRDITLALIKEEEKIKQEQDFYRIILKKEDIEDIEQLLSIEKYLHNKDVLHKLIYKTYIELPMNAMFGRIGAKEVPGIYKITNLKNNMVYIGQSTNVKNRLKAIFKHQLVYQQLRRN